MLAKRFFVHYSIVIEKKISLIWKCERKLSKKKKKELKRNGVKNG